MATEDKLLSDRINRKTFYANFVKEFKDVEGFDIIHPLIWGAEKEYFELAITRNRMVFAIVDYCPDIERYEDQVQKRKSFALLNTPASFFICYDHLKKYFVISKKRKQEDDGTFYIEDILYVENADFAIVKSELLKNIDSANDGVETNETVSAEKSKLKFYENTEKLLDPEWCRDQLNICHDDDSDSEITEICRFSTLNSLFSTIQYKTMRMNGLPGMNDKGEGLFAWDMINKTEKISNEEFRSRKSQINNAFIVSFSKGKLADDLTQWRLYGDDAKGVCCIYSVNKEKLKDRFFLHKVRYMAETYIESDDNLIRQFRDHVEQNQQLGYYDLSPAIFFYKPNSYGTEEEVRLLVDNKVTTAYKLPPFNRQWLLTNSNNIPNPFIDVPLESVPLKLERIILGPNMPDADTVQVQLETMLEQQGMSNVKVELSSIKSYRNPTN